MALSAFDKRTEKPTPAALDAMLGRSGGRWRDLIDHVGDAHGPIQKEWTYAGVNYGWSLRLKNGERAIVYLTPQKGRFLASFALGEKACHAAHGSGLSRGVIQIIDAAPKYVEGRGVRVPVKNRKVLEDVMKIATLKMTRWAAGAKAPAFAKPAGKAGRDA
jgi:hypothetical protein